MARKISTGRFEAVFLKEVEKLLPCVKGSFALVRKPCIRSNCKACSDGRKHPFYLFSYKEGGKRRSLYVPKEAVSLFAEAIRNGRRLEELMSKAGLSLLDEFKREEK